MRRAFTVSSFMVLATLAAYWPLREAGFVNFDDNQYITNNPIVFRGLTRTSLVWAFTTFHACNWHPLTWVSHMIDCQVFGENAAGHHGMNVAFHAANAVLLFVLLWRMTGGLARSGFVAALFALHPLHVGSVAWISERKDVLSTFFGLLSMWAYAERSRVLGLKSKAGKEQSTVRSPPSKVGDHRPGVADHAPRSTLHAPLLYAVSLLFFALGLMSKPMLVTLPFVLLLLDYWPLERFSACVSDGRMKEGGVPDWRFLIRQPPWRWLLLEQLPFVLLSAASAVVTFYAQKSGGAVVRTENVPVEARVENACISYVWYLAKTFWPTGLSPYYPYPEVMYFWPAVAAGGLMVAITVAALWLARRAPYLLTGWFWYLGMLVPVIGLVQVGSQAVADRYTYLPLVGIFVMVVWGAADLLADRRYGRAILIGTGAYALAACLLATSLQAGYWRDSILLFQRALAIRPDNNALSHHNLAHALSLAGDQRDAIPHFREAVREHPDFSVGQLNWGNAVGVQGKLDEAINHYREAIHYQPDYEQAYYQLANALALELKWDEAKTNFLAALRCLPEYPEAHTKLGNLLLVQGSNTQAMVHLHAAVKFRPDYEEGQYYLGSALARQRQFAEAAGCFRAAIKASPKYACALNDLAWILATQHDSQSRSPAEAVQLARRACQATNQRNPAYLDTLAVALSETGQFAEAMALTEKAAGLAAAAGDSALAAQMQSRCTLYRAGRSYTGSLGPKQRIGGAAE